MTNLNDGGITKNAILAKRIGSLMNSGAAPEPEPQEPDDAEMARYDDDPRGSNDR